MARLRTATGVTVEVADELADQIVGVNYARAEGKPARQPAKPDSK